MDKRQKYFVSLGDSTEVDHQPLSVFVNSVVVLSTHKPPCT